MRYFQKIPLKNLSESMNSLGSLEAVSKIACIFHLNMLCLLKGCCRKEQTSVAYHCTAFHA